MSERPKRTAAVVAASRIANMADAEERASKRVARTESTLPASPPDSTPASPVSAEPLPESVTPPGSPGKEKAENDEGEVIDVTEKTFVERADTVVGGSNVSTPIV